MYAPQEAFLSLGNLNVKNVLPDTSVPRLNCSPCLVLQVRLLRHKINQSAIYVPPVLGPNRPLQAVSFVYKDGIYQIPRIYLDVFHALLATSANHLTR